ncbi:MAG: glycerate kinase [Bacteroidota bacterium]|nr:glycerate kinase [Bacteroidota bacterium]
MSVSDGGEGFLDSIENSISTKRIYNSALNSIFEHIKTIFLLQNKSAFIEFAKTGGLNLIKKKNRNPMFTTSYGLGQQILEAKNRNAEKIIIGLGGSATNDGGIGMAHALGFRFYNKNKVELKPIGANLINIYKITFPENIEKLRSIKFYAATDVENELFGKNGASYVYASQKGALEKEIKILDKGLKKLSTILSKHEQKPYTKAKGDGAAGGLGYGIRAFLNGEIISGSDFIVDLLDIKKRIKNSDIVISGEGKVDKQSFEGKIVGKIANLTKKYNKHLIIFCGVNQFKSKLNNTEIYSLFNSTPKIDIAKKLTPIKIEEIIKEIFSSKTK